jgi:hypothetical protein
MKRLLFAVCVLAMGGLLAPTAQADWMENFDSYANGTQMHGTGGWEGWLNDASAGALVTSRYSRSPSNSVAIASLSDLVHPYSGYTSGQWTYTAWQYIPTSFTGETYFILLNTYTPTLQNWSVQVHFTAGQVLSDGPSGGVLPWVLGRFVELRLEIDLDNNLQTFYYDGNVLYTESWTEGMSGGGAVNIGAVDLFANGATAVYYDDISLVSGAVATESTTWGSVKALFH